MACYKAILGALHLCCCIVVSPKAVAFSSDWAACLNGHPVQVFLKKSQMLQCFWPVHCSVPAEVYFSPMHMLQAQDGGMLLLHLALTDSCRTPPLSVWSTCQAQPRGYQGLKPEPCPLMLAQKLDKSVTLMFADVRYQNFEICVSL